MHMTMRIVILGIIALTAGTAAALDFPEHVEKVNLSRGVAVTMALLKNIDLRVEALNSSMAETDAARSWGIYNPVLGITSTGGVSSVPGDPFFLSRNSTTTLGLSQLIPTGGTISATTQAGFTNADTEGFASTKEWQSSVGITISQPLLKNAGKETTELSISLAANTLQDSLERYRLFISDTVLSVITTYNHLYSLQQGLESRVAAVDSAQKLLEEISKRAKPGPLQAMEKANVEFAIAQRRKDLIEAYRNVRDQEASLRYLIGLESKAQIIPMDPPARDEPKETEEQVIKEAMESRSDLKQLRLALQTSELQERVTRHQSLPDLSLTGSGGLSGTGGNFGNSFRQMGEHPATYWTAGMQFNLPLGNTVAENDYRRSKIRTEQAKYQVRALEWRVRNDVEADLRALISARLQLQTADKSLQYATQRLDEYHKNSRLGTATIQDVLNAENDFTAARLSQLDASEAFANGVSKLWRDAGVLLERHNIRLDTSHPGKLTE
ncbi:MAG TPA: TolC family protein [Desulfuromonadaceae bacterium]